MSRAAVNAFFVSWESQTYQRRRALSNDTNKFEIYLLESSISPTLRVLCFLSVLVAAGSPRAEALLLGGTWPLCLLLLAAAGSSSAMRHTTSPTCRSGFSSTSRDALRVAVGGSKGGKGGSASLQSLNLCGNHMSLRDVSRG
jgi:hypothetical protein